MRSFDPATHDFLWLIRHVIATEDILGLEVDMSVLTQVVEAAADFIADQIAPLGEVSDLVGVKLVDRRVVTPPGWREAWAGWSGNGWSGLGMPVELGGQGMPFIAEAVVATMLGGADLGFAMVSVSARGAASVLAAHASAELRGLCVPRLASGEWTATIVITEPQAGSDVGLIRTKAVPGADGSFALSGTKIFISGGDHDLSEQILHVVLARIEGAPAGVRGLTLFLVPSVLIGADGQLGDRNSLSVARVEEKMGLHGSATCVLDFEGATGWMIGTEGQGLQALFTMMNELRLEVALSAVGICASATRHAVAYAQERVQGRDFAGKAPVAIIAHPDVQRMVNIMRCLTEGGRALTLEAASLVHLERHAPTSAQRSEAASALAWLLPICKAALSDNSVDVASLGIQIRGGHGYIREAGAEQYLRDARVLPIYEGTNGIHAGALATRGLQRDGGASSDAFLQRMRNDLIASADVSGVDAIRACLTNAIVRFDWISKLLLATSDQPAAVHAISYDYLTLAGRLALGWMWLRMAAARVPPDDVTIAQKRELAAFYAIHFESEMIMLASRIETKIAHANVHNETAALTAAVN